jgi:uncharacterized oligopeptide transporter (OPT) family protein
MIPDRRSALSDFWRMIRWIVLAGILMVIGALIYLRATGDLEPNMVIATILGVFFSVLLGCGLFAAAFFSDKSGHDREVTDATRRGDSGEPPAR